MGNECLWQEDIDGLWHTGCEEIFMLNSGLPSENGMKCCCYCGKQLREVLYEGEESDD